jgi:hypothetical protein
MKNILHYMLEPPKVLSTYKGKNLKDITMDNQQETNNYITYSLVGSSETTREAPINIIFAPINTKYWVKI